MGLVIIFGVLASTTLISAFNHAPVILVPGFCGSQLESKVAPPPSVRGLCDCVQWAFSKLFPNTYFSSWLNPFIYIPFTDKCAVSLLELNYNNVTRKTTNLPGIETGVVGFGDPYWIEYLEYDTILSWLMIHAGPGNSYFKTIADALQSIGYQRNLNLLGAPYDFRKGPNESQEYFRMVKALVEKAYKINGNKKVVFVTHSYGSPMTIAFLQNQTQQWKDKYIRAMISLAGALGGSVKTIRQYATGDEFSSMGFFFQYYTADVKAAIRTFPSMAFLMPNEKIWTNEVLVSGPQKNYSLSNLKEFLEDVNDLNSWEMRNDQLPYSSLEPPGVEFHCVYGTTENYETTEKLAYINPDDFPTKPVYTYGPGDGTVNLRSLEYCKKWTSQQKQKVHEKHLPNANHMEILNDQRTVDYIKQVLESDDEDMLM